MSTLDFEDYEARVDVAVRTVQAMPPGYHAPTPAGVLAILLTETDLTTLTDDPDLLVRFGLAFIRSAASPQ